MYICKIFHLMNFLYTLAIRWVACMLPLLAVFNRKIRLFYKGRRESFRILQTHIGADDQVIWLHAASLGEYEQGLPILKRLRELYPEKKLVVTFFSPSGYEAKKHSKEADVILYICCTLRWLSLSNMNFGQTIC